MLKFDPLKNLPIETQAATGLSIGGLKKKTFSNYRYARADYWSMEHRMLKGRHYRFDGEKPQQKRKFLQQMLADDSQYKTYQKSRQCGVSENSISEILYLCNRYSYLKYMYVFPTYGLMKDFVQTRIEPAITSSKHIQEAVDKKRDSVRLKHIFNCDILFRSGSKAGSGEGADIDAVFFDERDRMSTSILDAFREGLSASELGHIRDISTPSLPGMGVNLSFEKSDKKHWFVKCDACGHRQTLTFPDSLVHIKAENKYAYRCKKCKAIERIDRSNGEWVKMITDIQPEWSGYQVSQLDCEWISADVIVAKKERMLPQFFFNYVLGKPYIGSNLLILQHQINRAMKTGLNIITRKGKIVMGVDWGDVSWAVIGMVVDNKYLMILHYEKISFSDPEMHHKRVGELIEAWKVDTVVCDAGYGKDRNAALIKKYKRKVWACHYVDTRNSKVIENIWGKTRRSVTVNRTVTLKVMARGWLQEEFILPASLVTNNPLSTTYFKHLKSLAVKLEEVEEGIVWERIGHTGPDHLAHATNYMFIAFYGITGRGYTMLGFLENPINTMDINGKKIEIKNKNSGIGVII